MATSLSHRLADGQVVLIDGATGTEIERRGVEMVDQVWSGAAALTHPDVIQAVHEDYIERGAELIIANTFSCSRHVLDRAGLGHEFERLNREGIEIALAARQAAGVEGVVAAGSISTTEMGGEQPAIEVARRNYVDQARIQADAGADMIVLEMMREMDHTRAALEASLSTGLPVWVGYSCMLVDGQPWLLSGHDRLADALDDIADQPVELIAIMHTEIDDVDGCLDVVDDRWDGPVGVYAHRGRLDQMTWVFDDVISPPEHTAHCQRWVGRGVQAIGGCCGIGPDHIEHLHATLEPSPG